MNLRLNLGGNFGYGDSHLELLFRSSKVFRLHAILQDAAEAVRAHSGKGHSSCYKVERETN